MWENPEEERVQMFYSLFKKTTVSFLTNEFKIKLYVPHLIQRIRNFLFCFKLIDFRSLKTNLWEKFFSITYYFEKQN